MELFATPSIQGYPLKTLEDDSGHTWPFHLRSASSSIRGALCGTEVRGTPGWKRWN